MIEVNEITKNFKGIKAVDKVSFKVSNGEIVGLLGENGAGKTTTLRILATMLKPTWGSAIVNGKDVVKSPQSVRKEIGILFGGESGIYDRLTARENIRYFAELNDMPKEKINTRIDYLSKLFSMEEYIDRKAGKFSKGMKQKVALARSIVHDPEVMLFDEPTSGLDVTAAREVHGFIRTCKEEGKTIIFSSHSMQEVEKLCERVVIIHKGRIVEDAKLTGLRDKYDKPLEDIFVGLVGDTNEL
ncbi:MAG: ATP-binding cassette domain-containing protein [Alkaliphilus sp.]